MNLQNFTIFDTYKLQQESPAVADKPARRSVMQLYPLAEERLAISTKSIHRWKGHLVGYNCWQCGSSSIRLAVVGPHAWNRAIFQENSNL